MTVPVEVLQESPKVDEDAFAEREVAEFYGLAPAEPEVEEAAERERAEA